MFCTLKLLQIQKAVSWLLSFPQKTFLIELLQTVEGATWHPDEAARCWARCCSCFLSLTSPDSSREVTLTICLFSRSFYVNMFVFLILCISPMCSHCILTKKIPWWPKTFAQYCVCRCSEIRNINQTQMLTTRPSSPNFSLNLIVILIFLLP